MKETLLTGYIGSYWSSLFHEIIFCSGNPEIKASSLFNAFRRRVSKQERLRSPGSRLL